MRHIKTFLFLGVLVLAGALYLDNRDKAARLEAESQRVKDLQSELGENSRSRTSEIENLQKESAELRRLIQGKKDRIDFVRAKLQTEGAPTADEDQLGSLSEDMKAQQEKVKELEKERGNVKEAQSGLKAPDGSSRKAVLGEIDDQIKNQEFTIKDLQSQLQTLRRRRDATSRQQAAALQAQLDSARANLKDLRENRKDTVQSGVAEAKSYASEAKGLKRQDSEVSGRYQAEKSQLDQLRSRVDEIQVSKKKREENVQRLSNEEKGLSVDIKNLEAQLTLVETRLKAMKKQ